jgi:hypothetical protein
MAVKRMSYLTKTERQREGFALVFLELFLEQQNLSYIYLGYFVCLCVSVCVTVYVCVSQFVSERSAILLVLVIKLTKEMRRRV